MWMKLPLRHEPERTIYALAAAAEKDDASPGTHSRRVANVAVRIGRLIGLDDLDLLALYRGGLCHDIGKAFVSERILLKPGPLNAAEESQMREHPDIGERIVKRLSSTTDILTIIRHHHERFDGGGYPDGLRGHKIPLLARIVSVSDAYDALTSDRPYRARRSQAEAIEILIRGAGHQWDRELISLWLAELPAARFELAG
jgi:putative nucleotidyltransferase with HDIG domain